MCICKKHPLFKNIQIFKKLKINLINKNKIVIDMNGCAHKLSIN